MTDSVRIQESYRLAVSPAGYKRLPDRERLTAGGGVGGSVRVVARSGRVGHAWTPQKRAAVILARFSDLRRWVISRFGLGAVVGGRAGLTLCAGSLYYPRMARAWSCWFSRFGGAVHGRGCLGSRCPVR